MRAKNKRKSAKQLSSKELKKVIGRRNIACDPFTNNMVDPFTNNMADPFTNNMVDPFTTN